MSLATPPLFRLTTRKAGHLTLASDQGDVVHLFVLEDDVIRVLVLPEGRLDRGRHREPAYRDCGDQAHRSSCEIFSVRGPCG